MSGRQPTGLLRSRETVSHWARWQRCGGRPRRIISRSSTTIRPMRGQISGMFPARWAWRIVWGVRRARWSAGIGSSGHTSMAARMRPDAAASSRVVEVHAARAADENHQAAGSQPRRGASRSICPAFSVVVAARRNTAALRVKHSSSVTGSRPLSRRTPGWIQGSWTTISPPKGRSSGSSARPTLPKPTSPRVRPPRRMESALSPFPVHGFRARPDRGVGLVDAPRQRERQSQRHLGHRLREHGRGRQDVDAAPLAFRVVHVGQEIALHVEHRPQPRRAGEAAGIQRRLTDERRGLRQVTFQMGVVGRRALVPDDLAQGFQPRPGGRVENLVHGARVRVEQNQGSRAGHEETHPHMLRRRQQPGTPSRAGRTPLKRSA